MLAEKDLNRNDKIIRIAEFDNQGKRGTEVEHKQVIINLTEPIVDFLNQEGLFNLYAWLENRFENDSEVNIVDNLNCR